MSDTTTTEPVSLSRLRLGDTFTFRGHEYVLVEHKQVKSAIARIADGAIKIYNLSMSAKVIKTGRDEAGFRLALDALNPAIHFKVGDTVRVVNNARTRSAGVAGAESIVTKINQKSVALANGFRISPSMIEAV